MYSVFIIGLWLSYGYWAAPLVDKAMSTKPMMQAIAQVISQDAELGLVGMREKLLLHTPWETTHFGHHRPIKEQQQAAINWIREKSNRFLLVNDDYINSCFSKESSLAYDSFHSEKWFLFSNNTLDVNKCAVNNTFRDIFLQFLLETFISLTHLKDYLLCCCWLILPIQNDAKMLKITETLAYGYSSESTQ